MPANQDVPCTQAEARQFDFWLGDWELSWGEDGRGTNHVSAILNNCVIQEEFDGTPSILLKGLSISTYNPGTKKWHQTWVDNSGGYLDFVGEFTDGKMVLSRDAIVQGKAITQRMVFYNIAKNELDWNWERSKDGGKTWQVVWHIHYQRKH
ncbi:MAG: DUF1579 family protein [Anaerolineae bacterium]|jgi:hypothetical protein|nr:DUF1579 family protein [Anaerolineae bacterium]MBT7069932.1 DUF1579 family protein [Anaerolineae bacterium]MBT7325643.1 DUF1579 family protein [Anaerolineae bacterium]